jgi:hypothetical protein
MREAEPVKPLLLYSGGTGLINGFTQSPQEIVLEGNDDKTIFLISSIHPRTI